MRIFFITPKLNFRTAGGSIEEFDLMIRTLIKLGNEVTVVTVFSAINYIPDPPPYKVIEENINSARLFGIQAGILKILRKYEKEADFFHVDGHIFLYGAGFYRKFGGKVPISAFFNRELSGWPENISTFFSKQQDNIFIKLKKKLRWYIEKYFFMPFANGIDLLIFTNPVLKAEYEDFGLRRDPETLIMGDPIDYSKIMKDNGVTGDGYVKRNKKSGPITLFYSSRMAPGKGFDLLVKAFAEVKNKDNFRLILGGTGPEEKLVHQLAHDLGIEKYVEFTGWVPREKLLEFHKEADIFIQARWRFDMTSISLSYAMAFGLPSILPGEGGMAWVAKDSALFFKDGDYVDLARKIEKLGGDYKLREELSLNCFRRLAEDEMNYEWQIKRWNNRMSALLKIKN